MSGSTPAPPWAGGAGRPGPAKATGDELLAAPGQGADPSPLHTRDLYLRGFRPSTAGWFQSSLLSVAVAVNGQAPLQTGASTMGFTLDEKASQDEQIFPSFF